MSHDLYSRDEMKEIFIKAGFRIINLETNVKKYTFPDFSSLLSNYDHLYIFFTFSLTTMIFDNL